MENYGVSRQKPGRMTKISLFSEANRQKYLSFENPTIHVLVAPAYLLEGRVKVPRGER
jgi:hypothetical protein